MEQNRYDLLNQLEAVPTPPSLRGWKGVIGKQPPPRVQEDNWPPEVPMDLPRIPFGVNRWPPLPHQHRRRRAARNNWQDREAQPPAIAVVQPRPQGEENHPPGAAGQRPGADEILPVQRVQAPPAYIDDDVVEVCRRCNKTIPTCTCWGIKRE